MAADKQVLTQNLVKHILETTRNFQNRFILGNLSIDSWLAFLWIWFGSSGSASRLSQLPAIWKSLCCPAAPWRSNASPWGVYMASNHGLPMLTRPVAKKESLDEAGKVAWQEKQLQQRVWSQRPEDLLLCMSRKTAQCLKALPARIFRMKWKDLGRRSELCQMLSIKSTRRDAMLSFYNKETQWRYKGYHCDQTWLA